MEKTCHTNSTQKKANIAIPIPVKVGFDIRCVSREMEKYFTMIKLAKSKEDFKRLSFYPLKHSCKQSKKKKKWQN